MTTTPRVPTGKNGRGVLAKDRCDACGNSGWFRFRDGHTAACTNCPHGWRVDTPTWPGGYSAKNTHRAGAPNTLMSGENPMVGTDTTRPRMVADILDLLLVLEHRWLSVDHSSGAVVVDRPGLAGLIADVLTDQVKAQTTELSTLVWSLSSQLATLTAARDAAVREAIVREQEVIALTVDLDRALAQLSALDCEGGVA